MSQLQIPTVPSPSSSRNQFFAVIERRGDTHIASCPEVPGVQGQGRTKMAALVDLREAVARTLAERRNRAVHDAPPNAVFDVISIV